MLTPYEHDLIDSIRLNAEPKYVVKMNLEQARFALSVIHLHAKLLLDMEAAEIDTVEQLEPRRMWPQEPL